LNYLKGHAYFIRAARRIKERIPEAKFLVVGRKLNTDPGYGDGVEQLARDCGLADDVVFAGFREDAAGILSVLDVFVLSSILESCPNVVLEAMAMRVPVVATDVGAVSEMVLAGRTGWVVPPRDAPALAEAVLACLALPRDRVIEMTDAARKRVETVFAADIMAGRQYRIYERIVRREAVVNLGS